ncbi:hypothetical protein JCM10908_002561 [Rhodotorula pacifica]|uniref:choline/carnitine O-acyltransferase n=1 Tax=Rhodotorula pacifica TaxID=1495444 RepID=UPI00317C0B2F
MLATARRCVRRSLARSLSTSSTLTSSQNPSGSVHTVATDAMPPLKTPDWEEWRMQIPTAIPVDSVMFRNQHKLPKLPIPKLDDTLSRLVRSCEALADTPEAAQRVKAKVEAFRTGRGAKLHKLLEKKREQPGVRNWLARDWDEQAYMAYRDSVVVNVSYYYGYKRLPQGPEKEMEADPAYVAASIATTALEFRRLVTQGLLEPELAGRKPEDGELCMESYKWAFNACRVPASPSDYAVKTREDDPAAQCFVVVKQNRFYRIPFADEQGRQYSTDALRLAIQQVIDGANQAAAAAPVGILTGVNRAHWAEAYAHLAANAANVPSIRTIQQSAFVICLDEAEPTEIVDFSRKLWTGEKEAGNRWWDKPLQWVVYRNGEAGFIGEHSCMDGTPTARLNDFLSQRLLSGEPPVSVKGELSSAPAVKPLPFELDSTSEKQIQAAEKEFAEHIAPYEVHYTLYTRYGKEGIKKMKTSPDGWVQMLFQIAYYLTFKRLCATYEAAQTRRYQLGRTETVRILTPEVLAFVKAIVSTGAKSSTADKLSLFRAAIAEHGKDMKLASAGMGIDRHLFGLKMLASGSKEVTEAERKEVMEGDGLFADPLVQESGTWKMSTSQIYIENAPSYGWGPVAEGGIGVPYMIHPHTLQLTVTCKNDVPGADFVRNFERAADMLMDLHEAEAHAKL